MHLPCHNSYVTCTTLFTVLSSVELGVELLVRTLIIQVWVLYNSNLDDYPFIMKKQTSSSSLYMKIFIETHELHSIKLAMFNLIQ
jgi:hypothetical protein